LNRRYNDCGSFNFDLRARDLNTEKGMLIEGYKLAGERAQSAEVLTSLHYDYLILFA
jgi:phosphatidylserine/phosphatidylglycerophosphate/cardiolipin synthase-like enzyme